MRAARYSVGLIAAFSMMGSTASADSEVATRVSYIRPGHTVRFNIGYLPVGVSPAIWLYIDHKPVGAEEVIRPDLYQHPVSESVAKAYGAVVIIDVPAFGPVVVEAGSLRRHRLGIVLDWSN